MSENKEIEKECNGCCRECKENECGCKNGSAHAWEHRCGEDCGKDCGCGEDCDFDLFRPLGRDSRLDELCLPDGLAKMVSELDCEQEEKRMLFQMAVDNRSDVMLVLANMVCGSEGQTAAEMMLMTTAKVLYDAIVLPISEGKKNPHYERYVIAQAKRHLEYYFAQKVEGYEDMELDERSILPPEVVKKMMKGAVQ